jgi:multidrug efflux pump subunit AcrA (membrane-fusion protein)
MYAEVSLEMNRRPDALTVPAAAIGSDRDGNFVDTITGNRITRLAINTGLTDNGRVEVTAGLSEKTPVVATITTAPSPGTAVQPPIVNKNSQCSGAFTRARALMRLSTVGLRTKLPF